MHLFTVGSGGLVLFYDDTRKMGIAINAITYIDLYRIIATYIVL